MKDMSVFMEKKNVISKHNIRYRKSDEGLSVLKDNSSKFYTHKFNTKENHHIENDVSENFIMENLNQEVEELKKEVLKSKKKKQRKFILTTVTTVLMLQRIVTSSMLGSPMTAFATSEAIPVNAIASDTSATEMIKVTLDTLNTLLPQFRSLALTMGTLLLILVGILQMLRRKELVTGWVDDIIKGLVQILIAPMVVGLIYYATAHILGDSLTFSPVLP